MAAAGRLAPALGSAERTFPPRRAGFGAPGGLNGGTRELMPSSAVITLPAPPVQAASLPRQRAAGGGTAPRSSHLGDLRSWPPPGAQLSNGQWRQGRMMPPPPHPPPCLGLFKLSSSAAQSQQLPFSYSLTAAPAAPPQPSQQLLLARYWGGRGTS